MKNKLLKLSISFDQTKSEPAHIKIVDHETGYKEEVCGTVDNIKENVSRVLQRWLQEGRGALTPEVFEYYSTYVDYEIRRKQAEAGPE